jgi:ribosome-associated toxin RatA of RatAB toxin-antitoxin module
MANTRAHWPFIMFASLFGAGCPSSGAVGDASGRIHASGSASAAPHASAAAELPPVEAAAGSVLKEPDGRDATSEAVPVEDDLVRGRSTVRVDAPVEAVRKVVLRYDDYAKFMPFYTSSHVVDKDSQTTKVYMQVAALNGMVKMGAQISLPNKPKSENGWDVYESTFDKGNVTEFKAIWRMKAIDDQHSFLSLEVFLLPKLPLPSSTLNGENAKGAVNGVKAMRDRIEQK